jgi:hypothetical protein
MNQLLRMTHEEGPVSMKHFYTDSRSRLTAGLWIPLATAARLRRALRSLSIFEPSSSGFMPAIVILPDVRLVCKL